MRQVVLVMAIATYCLMTQIVIADPSPPVNQLMSESLSLWDYGIMKLDKELEVKTRAVEKDNYVTSSVWYDFTANHIFIDVKSRPGNEVVDFSGLHRKCESLIHNVKLWLGINYQTGRPVLENESIPLEDLTTGKSINILPKKSSDLIDFFDHPGGYQTKQPAAGLGEKLDQLVSISAWTFSPELNKGVACHGELRSKEISFIEKDKHALE